MHKARVLTLQALIAGMPCVAASPSSGHIHSEFAEVYAVGRIRRVPRRRILEILHSTRALDTTLRIFVTHHGCTGRRGRPRGLGQYLFALRDHTVGGLGHLTATDTQRFVNNISDQRNGYIHEAGATPTTDVAVQTLLSEMRACLVLVSRL
jgi:hypothetical protein